MCTHRLEDVLKWSPGTTHTPPPPPPHGQMNSVNGVQQKGQGCARPYGRTAISAVLQFVDWSFSQHPHLQFKNTHWLETATKLTVHCLSETLFDHAVYACVCVYTNVCVSCLSLFETSNLKSTLTLQCVCSECVCRFYKQVDKQHVRWDTGHVSLLVTVFLCVCLFFEFSLGKTKSEHW